MGAFGVNLFLDDVACDIRDHFVDLLTEKRDAISATRDLIEAWSSEIQDAEDGAVFWLALAATQWKYGCLSAEVRDRAISVIDDGSDLRRWEGKVADRRLDVLAALRNQLLSPQPPAKRPRKRKTSNAKATAKCVSPDGTAAVLAWELGGGGRAKPDEPQMQVIVEMEAGGTRGGGGVFAAECPYERVSFTWLDQTTVEVAYPIGSRIHDQKPSCYFCGRVIQLRYRAV